MYGVTVSRSFVAQHYLTVPNPGPEGELHSHQFTVTTTVSGPELDEYNYLVDIDELAVAVDQTVDSLRDETLNDLPAFDGGNPSVERLATVVADRVLEHLRPSTATKLRVTIDEDDTASVAYERVL